MEEIINYNNFDYILVNDKNINGKRIYHFLNTKMVDYLIDDKLFNSIDQNTIPIFSLFCNKENNKYVVIKDKKERDKLLEEFGMLPLLELPIIENYNEFYKNFISIAPYIYTIGPIVGYKIFKHIKSNPKKVTDYRRDEFIKEQNENFKNAIEKFGIEANLNQIERKLDSINIKTCNISQNEFYHAYYQTLLNAIYFKEYTLNDNHEFEKRARFHETIHYIAGRKYSFANTFSRLLIEGGTENLVSDLFGKDASYIEPISLENKIFREEKIKEILLQYNFDSNTSYRRYVSLIKQLEYVTNTKSYDSAINGNNHFIKAIVKELGPFEVLKLFAETNLMLAREFFTHNRYNEDERLEIVKQQTKLQDMILVKSFEKRFKNIGSPQEAIEYLENLRNFETYRVKITYLKENGDIEVDDTFKKYYQNKYEQLKEKFKETQELFDGYEYKEQKYNPYHIETTDKNSFYYHIIQHKIVENFKGNIDEIPRKLKVKFLSFRNSRIIHEINWSEHNQDENEFQGKIEPGILQIAPTEYIIYDSYKLKYPELSNDEITELFLKNMDIKKGEEEILLEEEELKRECESYKQMKNRKNSSHTQIKKVSLIDKLKNKIYKIFRSNNQDKEEKVPEKNQPEKDTQKASWDLSNWGEETKEKVLKKQEEVIRQFSDNTANINNPQADKEMDNSRETK